MNTTTEARSTCCNETVSRPTAGRGPWSCDNCGKQTVTR